MVPTLPKRLQSIASGPYAQLVKPLLGKKLSVGKRLVNDARVTDHHAIIPTEQPLDLKTLENDGYRALQITFGELPLPLPVDQVARWRSRT